MSSNYYDVVVIGMELGPLAAGALLARRGFRVLAVGQNTPGDSYSCYGFDFLRRPFRLYSVGSPAVRRVIDELRAGQLFKHSLNPTVPAYQVVLERARVDVFGEREQTVAEIGRELPEAASFAGEALEGIAQLNNEIDKLFDNDVVVPAESFLERREFSRAEVQNPFRPGTGLAPTADPDGSPFSDFLEAPVRFETAGAEQLKPLVRCRQMAGWLFDCVAVRGGRDGMRSLLVEQIVGQGGDRQPRGKVTEIVLRRGRVSGVRLAGDEEVTGCQVVLTDLSAAELAPLVPPGDWTKRFRALVEESETPVLGYSVNLGVSREVVPEGLADTAFVSLGPGLGDELLRVEQIPQENEELAALHVSCVVPPGGESSIVTGALRDGILDRMRWLVPFLDPHLKVIHSPFDGFGPVDFTGSAEGEAPPVPHPEEVPRWLRRRPAPDGVLGIESQPHRAGIKGLVMSGDQVISGLGVEGELLAAWGAARIAGKMDPRRERLVRSMRSKVEM